MAYLDRNWLSAFGNEKATNAIKQCFPKLTEQWPTIIQKEWFHYKLTRLLRKVFKGELLHYNTEDELENNLQRGINGFKWLTLSTYLDCFFTLEELHKVTNSTEKYSNAMQGIYYAAKEAADQVFSFIGGRVLKSFAGPKTEKIIDTTILKRTSNTKVRVSYFYTSTHQIVNTNPLTTHPFIEKLFTQFAFGGYSSTELIKTGVFKHVERNFFEIDTLALAQKLIGDQLEREYMNTVFDPFSIQSEKWYIDTFWAAFDFLTDFSPHIAPAKAIAKIAAGILFYINETEKNRTIQWNNELCNANILKDRRKVALLIEEDVSHWRETRKIDNLLTSLGFQLINKTLERINMKKFLRDLETKGYGVLGQVGQRVISCDEVLIQPKPAPRRRAKPQKIKLDVDAISKEIKTHTDAKSLEFRRILGT